MSTAQMPVYCPKCEAPTDATAKFCLQCGNDFEADGPITSTGHDVKALKEAIRARDDLSMGDKFDLIAKVEEGSNPIDLGIAVSSTAEAEADATAAAPQTATKGGATVSTSNPAATAAVALVSQSTDAWGMVTAGRVKIGEEFFQGAMELGMEASHHIHDISHGGIDETNLTNEDLRSIPVLKPPKRSFCPKCGSDILSHSNLQWKKWREHSAEVVQLQAQAAMEAALVQASAHYLATIDALEAEKKALEDKVSNVDESELIKKIEPKVRDEIRAELEKEYKSKAATTASRTGPVSKAQASKPKAPSKPAASAGLFGGGPRTTKKYEGEAKDKPDWFLDEGLETVYDPHGTGKPLKPKTILARSAEGNVRVQDVVRTYAAEGEDGLSELAWTSPFTRYIIEAYDSC